MTPEVTIDPANQASWEDLQAVLGTRVPATVNFGRQRGARALEGFPMITQLGQEVTWGELDVGSQSIFADAGFAEVSRPTLRRVVMRFDF